MRKCPKEEKLLEYLSIPEELSFKERFSIRWQSHFNPECKAKLLALSKRLEALKMPEPEVTESILSVYQRLKTDETLVLKGWKLNNLSKQPKPRNYVANGWLFRGGVTGALAGIMVMITMLNTSEIPQQPVISNQESVAQIRLEDKNRVEVHYIQPELLQTVEFETSH